MQSHTRLATVAALASFVALAVATLSAGVKVQADYSPNFDFVPLHTWTWNPNGAGNAVRIISPDDNNSTEIKEQFKSRVLPIVEAELVRRHFPKATGVEPDFYMTCYILVTVGDQSQAMGQFLGAVPEWGLPPFAPSTTALKVFPKGSLILDVTSPAKGEVVWRGVAQADLEWDDPLAKREQLVREAVSKLLDKFPPKKSKK